MRLSVALVLALAACGRGSPSTFDLKVTPKAPEGTPNRFVFEQGDIPSDSVAQLHCLTPLRDPRTGTRIALVRSWKGTLGDYAVDPPRYGVAAGELLRINCKSGGIVGIVPR
jgi:hypothetical protein